LLGRLPPEPLYQPFLFLLFLRVCDGYFWDGGVSQTICPGWLQTTILLISASWVARIIGMSHQCLVRINSLITKKKGGIWDHAETSSTHMNSDSEMRTQRRLHKTSSAKKRTLSPRWRIWISMKQMLYHLNNISPALFCF
jgi:hypothetical protein